MRVVALCALALAACSSAPSPEGESGIAEFLRAGAQDVESCFKGLPPLEGPRGVALRPGQPVTRPDAANRLVMAIDSSGSMARRNGGQTKMAAAKAAAAEFLSSVPEGVEIGLIAFGHRGTNQPIGKALSCAAVETLYPVGAAERDGIDAALRRFDATGWTPLAAAIRQAGRAFIPNAKPGAQILYVVSDGVETCGGDPVAAARELHGGPIQAVVNIIGFDIPPSERAALRAVAEAGGGKFIEVKTNNELAGTVADARRRLSNTVAVSGSTLANQITDATNQLKTLSSSATLGLCVNTRVASERIKAEQWLASIPDSRRRDAARAQIAARHAAFDQRVRQYDTAAISAQAGKAAEIKSEIERAQEALNATQPIAN